MMIIFETNNEINNKHTYEVKSDDRPFSALLSAFWLFTHPSYN